MSATNPAPDFDSENYARANDRWICGRAAEGCACRVGPDHHGRCRATSECVPALEVKPGETKGRWRCTRGGGPCVNGPLPDGACGCPIPKCSPVPTLRTIRGKVTRIVVAATVALLLVLLGSPPWRDQFINPGTLSHGHSGEAFARLHSITRSNTQTCAACHVAGDAGPAGMFNTAWNASPGPLDVRALVGAGLAEARPMDAACQRCHTVHDFHQPNVVREISCSFCHVEHRGNGRIPLPTDQHCAVCHADAQVMTASAAKRTGDSGAATAAQVISGFAVDHPEFAVHTGNRRDPNTLKFGHALHLTGATIPALPDGRKLDCAFCHQPDAAGAYFRPVTFENNCRVCHSLQFDPETPDLSLPHGSPEFVSAFLHSLPRQYSEAASRAGVRGAEEQRRFVQEKLRRLRDWVGEGEQFEQRLFFSTDIAGPPAQVGTVSGAVRALYPGCAYCHEVRSDAQGRPSITPPEQAGRWLTGSEFRHSSHSKLACTDCHAAERSRVTADLILPVKESCVSCHSPRGGVEHGCVTCHSYHRGIDKTGR